MYTIYITYAVGGSMNHLLSKRKDRKVIITRIIISKLHFAGSSTQRNLFTLKQQHDPGWSVERQCPGQGGAGTHAKEREGAIDTSKQKCHKSRNDGI